MRHLHKTVTLHDHLVHVFKMDLMQMGLLTLSQSHQKVDSLIYQTKT